MPGILLAIIIIALLASLIAMAALFIRPKILSWGATPNERGTTLAGDELIPNPLLLTTRAISIHTGRTKVWPWLVQMGQGRGGFYSYEWLENLIGLDIHNADRIVPELQTLQAGDSIPFWRGAGVKVLGIEPPCLLVLGGSIYAENASSQPPTSANNTGGTWVFALQESSPGETRLIVRTRVARFPPAWLSFLICRLLIEPAHFIMERGMLHGIRKRSERS